MGKNRSILVGCLPLLLLLCGFTRCDFDNILLGTYISDVERQHGDPYSVASLGSQKYEYIYVERFSMNNELVYVNEYILTVVNGQIVNKRIKTQQRQPFDQLYQPDPYYPQYP